MDTWTKIFLTLGLAFLSGVFGRMGGAGKEGQWYEKILDTNWRDIGCSVILMLVIWMWFGFHSSANYQIAYTCTFVLTFLSFRTYWDRLFGYDCFWFAGLMVGVAAFPMIIVTPSLWWLFLVRVVIISVVWELLNKKLPAKVWIWTRDVVEEFCRYFVSK